MVTGVLYASDQETDMPTHQGIGVRVWFHDVDWSGSSDRPLEGGQPL